LGSHHLPAKTMQKEESHQEYIEVGSHKGHAKIHISTGKMVVNNFLGGLAWGFGTVLGATLIVALVIFILSKLGTVPIIGDFVSDILQSLQNQAVQ